MTIFRFSAAIGIILGLQACSQDVSDAKRRFAFSCETQLELVHGSVTKTFDAGQTIFVVDEREGSIVEGNKDGFGVPKPATIFRNYINAEWSEKYSVGHLSIDRVGGTGTLKYDDRDGEGETNKFFSACREIPLPKSDKVRF